MMRLPTIAIFLGLVCAVAAADSSRGFGAGAGNIGESAARAPTAVDLGFDRHKGALYALYGRALRDDPKLADAVVFEITIAADGTVTDCVIQSSELHDAVLEQKLVKRILLFRFQPSGAPIKAVKRVDFFPAA